MRAPQSDSPPPQPPAKPPKKPRAPSVLTTYPGKNQWPIWDEDMVRELDLNFQNNYSKSIELPRAPCSVCHEWYPGQKFIGMINSSECRRCHTEKCDTWYAVLRRRPNRRGKGLYNLRNINTGPTGNAGNNDSDEDADDGLVYLRLKKFSEEN
jgi:hypothetical protein